jgi:hypothetical protein
MPYQLNDTDIIIIKHLLEDDENLPAVIREQEQAFQQLRKN